MSFEQPLMLVGLLAIPVVGGLIWLATQRRNRGATRFAAADMLDDVAPRAGWKLWVPPVLLLLALGAGSIALARPTMTREVPREQATLLLTLDTSLSMMATDVPPDRLDAAKTAAEDVLSTLPSEMRAGVVAFAANAAVVAPPSRDRDPAISAVESLQLAQGTAVGNAIITSLTALGVETNAGDSFAPPTTEPPLQPAPGDEPLQAIVLLSDGDTQTGVDPQLAAEQAAAANVPIYTVAFGTENAVIEYQGETIPVSVDAAELESIADTTGGEFFRAFDRGALEQIFSDIGSRVGLEETLLNLWPYFAAAAIVLLFAALGASLVFFGRLL